MRRVLAVVVWGLVGALFGVTFTPLPNADCLEPSIENEVNHALWRAYAVTNSAVSATNCVPSRANSTLAILRSDLSNTDVAIRLVSTQNPDGRWLDGTNDVTSGVIEARERMLDLE